MSKYARITNGQVAEIIDVHDSLNLSDMYHVEIVKTMVLLPAALANKVQVGWYFDGSGYTAPPPPNVEPVTRYIQVATIRERMEEAGTWGALATILQKDPAVMMKVLTLRDGVATDDSLARQLIQAAGSDPDEILAP